MAGWRLTQRTDGVDKDVRVAEYTREARACIECGTIGELHKHGRRTVEYIDAPSYGKQTRLVADLQRYRCHACSKVFMQETTGLHPEFRMTQRAFDFIEHKAMEWTFAEVAKFVGCDEKTVRNAVAPLIEHINEAYTPVMPEVLGLDETMLCGDYAAVLTDVVNGLPVDLLPSREPRQIALWLTKYRAHKTVKCVTTDMYPPYRKLVRELLPGVPVVADKFHVVRMADLAVEHVRRRVAKLRDKEVGREWKRQSVLLRLRHNKLGVKQQFNLEMWLDNEPDLKAAYWLKERFYDIYDCKDRASAARALDLWRTSVPEAVATTPRKDFKAMLTSTKNWREEILNYFDHPVTNGYTESLNGHMKRMNRAGFGYSFKSIRARVLWKAFKTRRKTMDLELETLELPPCTPTFIYCHWAERAFKRKLKLLGIHHE